MAGAMKKQGGIARAFAEFALLPDLAALVRERGRLKQIEPWAALLREKGCSLDHVEDADRPGGKPLWAWMAEDAFRLARRLGLMDGSGSDGFVLAEAGEAVALMADVPMDERGEAEDGALRSLLARQVRARYLGSGGMNVADFLLRAASAMQGTDHIWAKHCPGLLLVEFDALVHEAENDRSGAERLLLVLEENRDLAMRSHGRPRPGSNPNENAMLHSDAVADFYLIRLEHGARSSLTITGARASAMLFTFAGLLAEGAPVGPVQHLVPPPAGSGS